ncbi:hypothetical protein GCM10008938_14050 [Deinococcus roseus]|uniref:Lipoprotein n=1 Tax=Deinococcus roseus TaxID=392414 RepID=A0ABQ2CZI7_9DEIO|nr:hypothetical protein GCM10008938_14050 [Deinococcus roseus]
MFNGSTLTSLLLTGCTHSYKKAGKQTGFGTGVSEALELETPKTHMKKHT